MKSATLILLLGLSFSAPLFSQDKKTPSTSPASTEPAVKIDKLDAVPGFGGIKFGDDFATAGYEIEQDRGALKIYKKAGEPAMLGPVMLDEVLFHVYDGKFYGVAFHTEDGQDTLNLRSVFQAAFGNGTPSADNGPASVWVGKKVGALVDVNTATGEGSAFLFDVKLHDTFLSYESDAARAAAEKLLKGQ